MITIKKIEGNLKPFYTLIDDATNKRVGLVKGKNWLIKKQGWQLCNNSNYLTNHKNFMKEAADRSEIETTIRLNNTISDRIKI